MTQTQQILKHMKTGWITPLQALTQYGCFRLGARIHEIKAEHDIQEKWIHNNGKRYKAFKLERA